MPEDFTPRRTAGTIRRVRQTPEPQTLDGRPALTPTRRLCHSERSEESRSETWLPVHPQGKTRFPAGRGMARDLGSEKDVKIVETNSSSLLESTKPQKNELKTNSKRTSKGAEICATRPRIRPIKANSLRVPLPQLVPRIFEPDGQFEKDVKIVETNSTIRLESIKVVKNELKTNSKRSENPCSCTALKAFRARFLASLGMTVSMRFHTATNAVDILPPAPRADLVNGLLAQHSMKTQSTQAELRTISHPLRHAAFRAFSPERSTAPDSCFLNERTGNVIENKGERGNIPAIAWEAIV